MLPQQIEHSTLFQLIVFRERKGNRGLDEQATLCQNVRTDPGFLAQIQPKPGMSRLAGERQPRRGTSACW
jgi:hypothetical protein